MTGRGGPFNRGDTMINKHFTLLYRCDDRSKAPCFHIMQGENCDCLFCLLFCVLQTVYSAVTFAGYVGVMTGQRPNAFTVTVDERGRYCIDLK